MISCPGNARGMSSTEDISEKGRGENRAMIFCNTKKTCEQLEDGLNRARVRCDSIHGDKARPRVNTITYFFLLTISAKTQNWSPLATAAHSTRPQDTRLPPNSSGRWEH